MAARFFLFTLGPLPKVIHILYMHVHVYFPLHVIRMHFKSVCFQGITETPTLYIHVR